MTHPAPHAHPTPPTAELHVHIEGTIESEAIFAMAHRNGVRLPTTDPNEFRARYRFTDLQSFLDLYYENLAVLRTEQDFYDVTTSYLRRAHAANVRRAEIFFDPQIHMRNGVPLAAVMHGISGACQDAERNFGLSSALIMCFMRDLGPAAAAEMLEASTPYRDLIIGVGLDSTEIGYPNRLFSDVFATAAAAGLHLVAHAGEEGDAQSVAETLEHLRVERIDHGVRALEDPDVVAHLCDRQVPLTVCPLSNVRLRVVDNLANHPLSQMLDRGLLVTVNSDDPAYFGGYVDANYRAVQHEFGLTPEQMQTLALNSFDASFASHSRREAWKQEVRSYFTAETTPVQASGNGHGQAHE